MALKNERYFDTIPSSYKVIGAAPIDLRQVVQNLDNLYGEIAEQTHTWDIDGDIVAYDGMLVGVLEERKIYMCIDYLHPYVASSWKILNPDLDISGEMINVIYFNGDATHEAGYYNEADGSGEPWEPNEDAEPIIDEQVDAEGKYLLLQLNETDKVYIKSTDLIDLTDYYTKEQVDEKINILDSSVSVALEDLKDYVDTQDGVLDEKINALDSSLTSLKEYVDVQDAFIKDYVDSENDKINQRLDGVDASITNITNQITEFVNTVEEHFIEIDTSLNNLTDDLVGVHETLDDIEERHEADVERIDEHLTNIDSSIEDLKAADTSLDTKIEEVSTRLAELEVGTVDSISTETPEYLIIDTSKGDVTINIDVSASTDSENFPNTALATNGYVDEKMAWVEVEDE